MGKDSNIVHQYFKKEFQNTTILVKVNPILFSGTELTIMPDQKILIRELSFDEDIQEALRIDGFLEASAMEFNLYHSGLL